MIDKIKSFITNKFFLLSLIIICTVFATIAIGLGIGVMRNIPEELLPMARSFVAFVVMGDISLIILVVSIMAVINKFEKTVKVKIDPVPAPVPESISVPAP